MPRTLVLIRHAKSDWPDGMADHERPLAGRGRRDAPAVGRWLRAAGLAPELAVVSDARRTVETFELLAAELTVVPTPLVTDDAYAAGAGSLLDLVRAIPATVGSALIVAHNPGIGTLAGALDDMSVPVEGRDRMRLEFPTSATAVFDLESAWSDVDPGGARLRAFAVPRG